SYRYDYEHVRGFVSAVGALTGFSLSGEEKQIDFTGAGTVLVQSSEMGLNDESSPIGQILSQLSLLSPTELGTVSSMAQAQAKSGR
ncbi:MAG: AIM24 family protein, partial [Telluria sp.]